MTGPAAGPGRTEPPPELLFRPFTEGDVLACGRLARDAWPAGPGIASRETELAGMEGYVRYSLGSSNWGEVACTDDGIAGFLLGRIDGLPGGPPPDRGVLGELPSMLASALGDEHRPRLLGFLWSLALTEVKVRLNTPDSDASVEMFIVGSGSRGKGVGTALLERFLAAARGAGSSLVTVYTDELMSDWRFYENRGFRKVATFHDNITSHYSGSHARGIIFSMDLRERRDVSERKA